MVNDIISPIKNLNARQAEFVKAYVACGDPNRAALIAGYSETTARGAATHILETPNVATAIAREAKLRLARGIPAAIETVEWLMLNSPSHKVRLDAATRYLDRAGIVPPKAADAQSEFELPLNELSAAQLQALIIKLEHEFESRANQAKDVTPASPDPAADLVD
jgi:Terminase small subunit